MKHNLLLITLPALTAPVVVDNSAQWKDTCVELPADVFGNSGNKTFVLERGTTSGALA